MPRVVLGHNLEETPLSVAMVAAKLGVATSTLRTWERRYGLGPSARTTGSHRRYTALDVARLAHMRELVSRGYSACDAAQKVLHENLDELQIDHPVKVDLDTLEQAALRQETHIIRSILDQAVAEMGLVKTYTTLFCPVLSRLQNLNAAYLPGCCPQILLRSELMNILRFLVAKAALHSPQLNEAASRAPLVGEPVQPVLIVSNLDMALSAHVLGAALCWEGIPARQLCTSTDNLVSSCEQYFKDHLPGIVVLVDIGTDKAQVVQQLRNLKVAGRELKQIMLLGPNSPSVLSSKVIKLQSLPGAICEIQVLAAS